MLKKLAVEAYNAKMFMPFDKDWASTTASPFVMKNSGVWHEENFFAGAGQANAPIQIFAMQKISFIPWADLINDGFIGMGEGIKKYEMWVFDRWGNMIYYTDDLYKPWDGKINGEMCQIDVYVWKCNVTDVFDKKHKFIGHVSLIR